MLYRRLGNSGIQLSVVSLGSWTTFGDQISESTAGQLMEYAYEQGINYFDNAEVYANGTAEEVMGRALQKFNWRRDSYVLSSKVFWGGTKPNQFGLNRKHILEACDASLKRMKTEYFDLYFCHRYDENTTLEETVRSMHQLVTQGKVLYWGTSCWTPKQINQAYSIARQYNLTPPTMEQPQYNLFSREVVENQMHNLCKRIGLGLITWSPLLCGILTGKYNTGTPLETRITRPELSSLYQNMQGMNGQHLSLTLNELAALAQSLDTTLPCLAIAFLLKNSNVNSVLLGASKLNQLKENMGAVRLTELLNNDHVTAINRILKRSKFKLQ